MAITVARQRGRFEANTLAITVSRPTCVGQAVGAHILPSYRARYNDNSSNRLKRFRGSWNMRCSGKQRYFVFFLGVVWFSFQDGASSISGYHFISKHERTYACVRCLEKGRKNVFHCGTDTNRQEVFASRGMGSYVHGNRAFGSVVARKCNSITE